MSKLDKRKKNPNNEIESKEEQRNLLSSNNGVHRCSSLGFNPNSDLISEEVALDYLAGILVRIFLSQQKNENKK